MSQAQILVAHLLKPASSWMIYRLEQLFDNAQIESFLTRSRSLPETPFDFSLKMRPSCQTSSALEISKNIVRVPLDGYLSNTLCISLVIERS